MEGGGRTVHRLLPSLERRRTLQIKIMMLISRCAVDNNVVLLMVRIWIVEHGDNSDKNDDEDISLS